MSSLSRYFTMQYSPRQDESCMASAVGEAGAAAGSAGQGLLGTSIGLLVAKKSAFELADDGNSLDEMAERMTGEAFDSTEKAVAAQRGPVDVTDPSPVAAIPRS